ncbi:MAG: hypothetical protein ACOYCA_05855 [Eggerthellaceae bacterium]|jgi:hypothetical protein
MLGIFSEVRIISTGEVGTLVDINTPARAGTVDAFDFSLEGDIHAEKMVALSDLEEIPELGGEARSHLVDDFEVLVVSNTMPMWIDHDASIWVVRRSDEISLYFKGGTESKRAIGTLTGQDAQDFMQKIRGLNIADWHPLYQPKDGQTENGYTWSFALYGENGCIHSRGMNAYSVGIRDLYKLLASYGAPEVWSDVKRMPFYSAKAQHS